MASRREGPMGEMWSRCIVSPRRVCQCLFLAGMWMVRSAMSVQSRISPASKVSLPVLRRMALLDLHFLLATLTSLLERASCSIRSCPCPRSVAIGKSGADEKNHRRQGKSLCPEPYPYSTRSTGPINLKPHARSP